MAANLDPLHVSARHQALHHFVARSEWSDAAVLERVREWLTPFLGLEDGCYWIVDDTGFPKKGQHSVGVARQYCGQLGKQHQSDDQLTVEMVSQARKRFANLAVCSFDKSFHSKDNQAALKEQLELVVLPRKGKLSQEARMIEQAPEFVKARPD